MQEFQQPPLDRSDGSPVSPPTPPPLPVERGRELLQVTSDERSMAMLCHLLGIFTGFVGPLILWLFKKDESPYVDHHGREALNFQITLVLVLFALGFLAFALLFLIVGIFIVPVMIGVQIAAIVLQILACVSANRGSWDRYPCSLRLV